MEENEPFTTLIANKNGGLFGKQTNDIEGSRRYIYN